jgi:hypothetical protein
MGALCSLSLTCVAQPVVENQTPTTTPILSGDLLPFTVTVDQSSFQLPSGFHSGVVGHSGSLWLFLAGRTNGLHGFENDDDNFPVSKQNTYVHVVDFVNQIVHTKSLTEFDSGLSPQEVDLLSVTSPQFYQRGNTLYMTGGYGVNSSDGSFGTKDALTAIDVAGLINWVVSPQPGETAVQHIRQIFHPTFQVTGGEMSQTGNNPTLLVFGQNFDGFYSDTGNGTYTNQVRRFRIIDDGHRLSAKILKPTHPSSDYRRRDLNIVPYVKIHDHKLESLFVALSGVFTPSGGIWTVPVAIRPDGDTFESDPSKSSTFKQGMNNYVSANAGFFSRSTNSMYTTLFGGISFGFFSGSTFETDDEIPFINQITTIKNDSHGNFSQYIMAEQFPVIPSTGPHVGNPLLFGAAAEFVPIFSSSIPRFDNGVIDYDKLTTGSYQIGYIVGGIQSTVPNTATINDSSASRYIFNVFLNVGGAI